MSKANKDDIAAIASRMDAAVIVLLEAIAESTGKDPVQFRSNYTKRYDALSAKFRKTMIEEVE